MRQKKCYKTWKFWITSLLALSASSIVASLALTSCVSNSSSEPSIVINNQTSGQQEFAPDDSKNVTLSVDAISNKGETLCYQWYVNKDLNGGQGWEKINGATSSTYSLSPSDIKDVIAETTWLYKAEVYPENHEELKIESKHILVKIKPSISGSVPENKPNDNPNLKPDIPVAPTPPIQPPNNAPEPTPPSPPPVTPPNYDYDNPTIVPSPEHIPSQGVGARLPLDKNGIVTTKYDQEKWIGDNSLSISIVATPNINGIKAAVDKFNSKSSDPNIKRVLNDLIGSISYQSNNKYNHFGTGWLLDYSNDNSKNGVVDYYIASNMHVLNSYFEWIYNSTRYIGNGSEEQITVGVRIPFNKHTVSDLNIYISQPIYSTIDYKNNLKTYTDQLSSQWYKTNIDINNWSDSLIPLGAYNPQNNNSLSYSQAFDMELTWEFKKSSNMKQTLYFKSSDDGTYLASNPDIGNTSFQYDVDDFSVFKISLNNNEFDNKIKTKNSYSEMFRKMKEMFDVTTNVDVKENSSYLKKLKKLVELTSNKENYNKSSIDDLFMFNDITNITSPDTQISIGGYPLIQEQIQNNGVYNKSHYYTTFNTNTLTGNNIMHYPSEYYYTRDSLGINQYTYKDKLYKIKWKGPNNFILKNVDLLHGSSGSIGIDQNYKLTCINWGAYVRTEIFQGVRYILYSSSSTGLYSPNNKNSLIWKWVDYMRKNNVNSKLTQLFNQLENINYFK